MSEIGRPRSVDVVVVGAGPAGAAAAIALARAGRSVVVLERSGFHRPCLGEHVPPAIRPLLRELGLSESSLAPGRSAGISILWGEAVLRHTDYMFEPYGFGYGLDRHRLLGELADVATAHGAAVHRRRGVDRVRRLPDGLWRIDATNANGRDERIVCRFLVDASGRSGWMARRLGSIRRLHDRLVGVAVPFAGEQLVRALDSRLIVESSENGWWYATAFSPTRADVVLMTDTDILRRGKPGIEGVWRAELGSTQLLRRLVPNSNGWARPVVRSAATSVLAPMNGSDWLAIGDAAMSHDPLASQGICEAIRSGLEGGQAVDRAIAGDAAGLERIVRDREESFVRYLRQRSEVYRWEQRWPRSPFWRRRHRTDAAVSGAGAASVAGAVRDHSGSST